MSKTTYDYILKRLRLVDPASKINYDNTSSGMTAETVQDAIDEVNTATTNLGNANLGNANLVADANQRTYKLLGNLSTDTLSILNNAGSNIVDFQGDQNARFHGGIGVNGVSPTPGYGIYSNGSIAGVRGGGYYGAILDGTSTGAYINGVAAGGEFHSSGGNAILGIQGSGLSALKTDGKTIAINYKVNADYGTLAVGDEYYALASDILANGDLIKAVKI